MGNLRISEWRKVPVSLADLCLETTLRCGQSFRWKMLRNNEWSCALSGSILVLKQDSTHLHYQVLKPDCSNQTEPLTSARSSNLVTLKEHQETEVLLKDYFNLKPDLTSLYEKWSSLDPNFRKRAPKFTGVRILRQDAWEALIAFICSSNNNIARISQMVNNLCLQYGALLGYVDGQPFHDFPTPDALAGPGIESQLRQLGFGYRAGYIAKTASIIVKEKPEGWLQSLCNPAALEDWPNQKALPTGGREGYRKAHDELLELQGVGPKVADCVCLMGLKWGEAVPIDTHVWQIAQRDYKFGKGKHKSLTRATYDAIGDYFRQLWGSEAGWAHSVLFAADLRTFSDRLDIKSEVNVKKIKIEQKDGTILEENLIMERQHTLDEVKDKLVEEKVGSAKTGSRTRKLKRRRIG